MKRLYIRNVTGDVTEDVKKDPEWNIGADGSIIVVDRFLVVLGEV